MKNLLLWTVIAVVLMLVIQNLGGHAVGERSMAYSDFLDQVEAGQVERVVFDASGREITGRLKSGDVFVTYSPETDNKALIGDLREHGVRIEGREPERQSLFGQILISWFPFLLLIGVWIYFMRQMQGGGGRSAMSFGKSRAKLMSEDQVKVTFADVAGVDEAKEEVRELVDFLRDPAKFQRLGGTIPRGVLMVGSPGTGKTLLAQGDRRRGEGAVLLASPDPTSSRCSSASAPRGCATCSSRPRSTAPCIIFMDEIDAVGRHRGAGLGGGHDEREQTLNQLLVEMDGFEARSGIILIAATNRPDVLDPALLRPGRFRPADRGRPPRPRGPEPRSCKVHMPRASRSPRHRPGVPWPASARASPAPTWPTWSTRRRCSPRAPTSARWTWRTSSARRTRS
ncbi:MAG: hypothetical protein KatS3mg121_1097 [Gammaproteobacteria bacterium]|nr:MAG: hypothetical protein KatS3mg121_1097 [Gammaproteobacteria bacterium]